MAFEDIATFLARIESSVSPIREGKVGAMPADGCFEQESTV